MLDHRLRHLPNIKTTLYQGLIFAGILSTLVELELLEHVSFTLKWDVMCSSVLSLHSLTEHTRHPL